MTINGTQIKAKQFAWDGCHKIYLINTDEDKKTFLEYGYDLFPISELEEAYNESCSLRFISNGDLSQEVVSQFQDATFSI
jgi:hypothetical protein